jgi:hypothetical protein
MMTYGEQLSGPARFALVTDYAFAIVTTDKSVAADWPGASSAGALRTENAESARHSA